MNILAGIMQEGGQDSRGSQENADHDPDTVQPVAEHDIRTVTVGERRNVLQERSGLCNIGNEIDHIEQGGDAQAGSQASLAHESGEAEADTGNFQLEEKVSQVQQEQPFPGNLFPDGCHGTDSQQEHHQVENGNPQQDGNQLFRDNPHAADRVGEEKLRCMLLFFL